MRTGSFALWRLEHHLTRSAFRLFLLFFCFSCFSCLPFSLVRECRGAQAIGRDSREKNVMKFDLAWKNLLISAVVQAGQLTQNNVTTAADAAIPDVQQPLAIGQAQTYTFV